MAADGGTPVHETNSNIGVVTTEMQRQEVRRYMKIGEHLYKDRLCNKDLLWCNQCNRCVSLVVLPTEGVASAVYLQYAHVSTSPCARKRRQVLYFSVPSNMRSCANLSAKEKKNIDQ